MVLPKETPSGHLSTERELPALEARHHGFGARRGDDGALRLLDVAKAVRGELCVGHQNYFTRRQFGPPKGDNLRMSFKTTLFKALEVAATAQCNGHQVVSKMLDQTPEALLKLNVDLDRGATLYIHDAEIIIDDEGRAYGTASDADTEPLVWSFQVVHPLSAHDVLTIERPPLNVAEVVGRLKAIR
jgi:hypothetical protein